MKSEDGGARFQPLDGTRPRLLLGEFRAEGRHLVALNDDVSERVRALEAGCLDALPHSLEPDELALKVAGLTHVERVQPEGIISAGPLTVDLSARRLVWNGDEVSVSPLLLALTAYLAARAGRLTPARTLLEDVWGEPWADLNKVHQAVYRLRHRLGEPGNSAFLIAKRGHGYGLFPETIESPSVDRRLAIHVKDSSWPSDLSRPGPATSRWLMMGRVAECEVIPGTPSNWGRRPGVSGCVDSP